MYVAIQCGNRKNEVKRQTELRINVHAPPNNNSLPTLGSNMVYVNVKKNFLTSNKHEVLYIRAVKVNYIILFLVASVNNDQLQISPKILKMCHYSLVITYYGTNLFTDTIYNVVNFQDDLPTRCVIIYHLSCI